LQARELLRQAPQACIPIRFPYENAQRHVDVDQVDPATERRMMQCRMCSQRLTRPGKLCRECERELDRARLAAASVDDLAMALSPIDASRMAGGGSPWSARLRTRSSVIAVAFAIGLGGALAIYHAQHPAVSTTAGSVMLDRDVSSVRARAFGRRVAVGEPVSARNIADTAARTDARVEPPMGEGASAGGGLRRVAAPVQSVPAAETPRRSAEPSSKPAPSPQPLANVAAAVIASDAGAGMDRVLALSDAFARCAQETFFARVGCEQRARLRYCDGVAAQLPQCADQLPRDHGQ
jgi:hypothetical protein